MRGLGWRWKRGEPTMARYLPRSCSISVSAYAIPVIHLNRGAVTANGWFSTNLTWSPVFPTFHSQFILQTCHNSHNPVILTGKRRVVHMDGQVRVISVSEDGWICLAPFNIWTFQNSACCAVPEIQAIHLRTVRKKTRALLQAPQHCGRKTPFD